MSKFRVGDRVRLLSSSFGKDIPVGTEGVVVKVKDMGLFPYKVDFPSYKDVLVDEHEIEPCAPEGYVEKEAVWRAFEKQFSNFNDPVLYPHVKSALAKVGIHRPEPKTKRVRVEFDTKEDLEHLLEDTNDVVTFFGYAVENVKVEEVK